MLLKLQSNTKFIQWNDNIDFVKNIGNDIYNNFAKYNLF